MDRETLAVLGMLSGDRVLAPTGKTMLEFEAAKQKRRGRRHIGQGFFEDEEGNIAQDPTMAQALEDREDRRDDRWAERNATIFGQRQQAPQRQAVQSEGGYDIVELNPNAPGGAGPQGHVPVQKPLSNDDRQKAAEANRLMNEGETLFGQLNATPGAMSMPKDTVTAALAKLPVFGGPARQAAQESFYTPAQLKVKTRGARYEQNLSNLAAGLALTGYEIEQRDKWSPFAAGISQEEGQRRLENINADFAARRDSILGANAPLSEMTIHPRGSAEEAAEQPALYYVPGKGFQRAPR